MSQKLYRIVTGPSVNPEQLFYFNSLEHGDKKTMTRPSELLLAGSSANVLHAVRKHGGDGLLVGFVSAHDTLLVDVMLREALKTANMAFEPLHVLDGTNIAVIQIDENGHSPIILCQTHKVLPHKVSGAEADIDMLSLDKDAYGVATGIRPGQEFFAIRLFERILPGRRILNFNKGLGSSEHMHEVIRGADMVVVNELELQKIGLTPNEVHRIGPKVVIVTEAEKGGVVSVGGSKERFEAVTFEGSCTSNTGAGDWFLGTLVWWLEKNALTVHDLNLLRLKEGVSLAAKVAGKKITMPGGANGPSISEL